MLLNLNIERIENERGNQLSGQLGYAVVRLRL